MRGLLWGVLLLLLPVAGCVDEPERGTKLRVGETVPAFSVELNDGRMVGSRDFYGRGGLILFFNTECGDCRAELPEVDKAYRMLFGDTPEEELSGPLFVCIARGQTEPVLGEYWRACGLVLPYSPQASAEVYSLFSYRGIPRIYIIGVDMRIKRIYGDKDMPTAEDILGNF